MIKVIICVGIPGSGKSTWAKKEVAKDPLKWLRISNDDFRAMANGSVFSTDYEKLVSHFRKYLIREGLKRNLNIIVDNVNIDSRHYKDVCEIASSINKDIQVFEKVFFIDKEEAIKRDSLRESKVGSDVIERFWKKSGGKQFKFYNPKSDVFVAKSSSYSVFEPLKQDNSLPRAVIFDNDGTISLIHNRSPYDASTCDEDLPHEHVIECMKLYHNAGYKIFFVSGREEKDRAPTERFYAKHFPEVKYELYMRPTGSKEKDVYIKKSIYEEHIKGKYFVAGWFDDRKQIVEWLFEESFPLFRVGDPNSSF